MRGKLLMHSEVGWQKLIDLDVRRDNQFRLKFPRDAGMFLEGVRH